MAAFVFQFRFDRKNTGILISHAGLILLLVGQFLTQTRARESQMPLEIGQSGTYSESTRDLELAFTRASDPRFDEVTAIPASRFNHPGWIETPSLPFRILIKTFSPGDENANSSVALEVYDGDNRIETRFVSSGKENPSPFRMGGKDYQVSLRPRRFYLPFQLMLKEFRHDIYPGTAIPKNFSSRVHLSHPEKNENRDVLIYMNHPLRYEGKTFYQASFGKNDTVSVFQVVQNPAWLTPYVSCALVLLGLAIQFLMHLIGFARKRS
jgi:hypothetical protein